MVNTRILEQRMGWRRGHDPDGSAPADGGMPARGLRHEPLLQGRVQPGGRAPVPAAAGLAAPRGGLSRARVEDTWAAIDPVADSLEAAVARRGALPPLDRDSPAATALDQLRGALLRAASARGWRRIGLSAPRRGAGVSFMAIGLAASIARLDYLHVALIDLDLGHPTLDRHLGLPAPGPFEAVLRGQTQPLAHLCRVGANLALALNARPVNAAADLLHSPEAILALRALDESLQPDVSLLDLPPLLTDPAAQAALTQVDAVLLVADGTRTTARDIADCERLIKDQAPLLGVVLNKSEDRPAPATSG